jgi:hypothetical protein
MFMENGRIGLGLVGASPTCECQTQSHGDFTETVVFACSGSAQMLSAETNLNQNAWLPAVIQEDAGPWTFVQKI